MVSLLICIESNKKSKPTNELFRAGYPAFLAKLPVNPAKPETRPPIKAVINMSMADEPPSGKSVAIFWESI